MGAAVMRGRGSVAWAVMLSLLPGLGHVYARAWRPALVFMALSLGVSLLVLGLTSTMAPTPHVLIGFAAVALATVGLTLYAMIDAGRRARSRGDRPRNRWFASTWVAALMLLGLGAAVDAPGQLGWRSFWIPSASMLPALQVGDVLLADMRHGGAVPARGDIVIFSVPRSPGTDYVKRVIGLPGDRIELRRGALLVNGAEAARQRIDDQAAPGQLFQETLPGGRTFAIARETSDGPANTMPAVVVPPGQVFVMGDNRDNSLDSRFAEFGTVPVAGIHGTAATLIWSRDRSRLLQPVQ